MDPVNRAPNGPAPAASDVTGPPQTSFASWWKKTPEYEGNLAAWESQLENRADRGGRTNHGITEQTFRGTSGAARLPPTRTAFESMTVAQARSIALAQWRAAGLDGIRSPAVALVVGDWYWGSNSAAVSRVKALLRALGHDVPKGARFDAETVAALNALAPRTLIDAISDARLLHHRGIAGHDPSQRVFLRGWQRRTEERRAEALELLDGRGVRRLGPSLAGVADEQPVQRLGRAPEPGETRAEIAPQCVPLGAARPSPRPRGWVFGGPLLG